MKRFQVLKGSIAVVTAFIIAVSNISVPIFAAEEDTEVTCTDFDINTSASSLVEYTQEISFTVKIPKSIHLNSDGSGNYTVGVKGKIPSKFNINIVPDKTVIMIAEHGWSDDIEATVTAEKTEWKASELQEDSYLDSTKNMIQMKRIDYAVFQGTLNFTIQAQEQDHEMSVEDE